MTEVFEKPERSCFNLTHYAKLLPESHCIFIMPPGCSRILRLSSIEEGISQRFTMFNLEQADIINGDVESILIDGAMHTIDRLTALGRRPKIFAVFVSCVDSFIGTDHDYVMAELRAFAPDIHFLDLAVDPINRDTLPPLVRLHHALTDLFHQDVHCTPKRRANWLGHYLQPDCSHPLVYALEQQGIASWHPLNCSTLSELSDMGNSIVNIVASPVALPAARKLKTRFGTPYYNLLNPDDAESISEEALLAL